MNVSHLFVEGVPLVDLAAMLNTNYHVLLYHYHRGLRTIQDFKNIKKNIEKRKKRLDGLLLREIAERAGIARSTVILWRNKLGFTKLEQFIERAKSTREKPIIDLAGQRFGKLTVKKMFEGKLLGITDKQWHVKCDCGNEFVTSGIRLRNGQCTSCGCSRIKARIDGLSLKQAAEKTGLTFAAVANRYYFKGIRHLDDLTRG